jgi:hypothetical protein
MVYYLGRDVDVYITTESKIADQNAVAVDETNSRVILDDDFTSANARLFANSMNATGSVVFSRVSDLTGCDLSTTASDEDIGPFFGKITTQKIASGRKETTVSLTRKKKSACWDLIYNGPVLSTDFEGSTNEAARMGARYGLGSGSATGTGNGIIGMGNAYPTNVKDSAGICYGYRVHVRLRDGDGSARGQIFTVPNCVITGHSVSVNPDGTSEETMEFTSSVMPIQNLSATAAQFDVAQTAAGMF